MNAINKFRAGNKLVNLSFSKENDKWYIDFPDYPFAKANLEMVAGADEFLEYLSGGKDNVSVVVEFGKHPSSSTYEYSYQRTTMGYGATYNRMSNEPVIAFWLCPVTLMVLGKYPKYLYINKYE